MSRHTPHFKRPNLGRSKRSRLDDKWKRPRGVGNKQRQKLKQTWPIVSIGYSRKRSERGKHPSGLKEVIVSSVNELKGLKDVIVRIAGSVGIKKRLEIEKRATENKLKIANKTGERKLKTLNDKKAVKASKMKKKEKIKKKKEEEKSKKEVKEKASKEGESKAKSEQEVKGKSEKSNDSKKSNKEKQVPNLEKKKVLKG
ncbi:hypothetical protein J7J90_03820 [Candidatus Micrarchaeota archaeon]|nr:hypothetical protein [Candidatus Micrarchaeota archaeon]